MKTSVILKMISETNPAPQVVTCGSQHPSCLAYKAFDKQITDIYNTWGSLKIPDWIKINLGKQKTINCLSITNWSVQKAPKKFILQGSNDDKTYINLKSFTETSWKSNKETKTYILNRNEKYQYYKLNIESTSDGGTVCIAEIDLIYDDELFKASQKIKEDVINEIKNTLDKYSDSILLVNIEGDN